MCERACAEVDAVTPGKVYVGRWGENTVAGFFVFSVEGVGTGEDDDDDDDGISGCRCVSFDLAVTSCFHTITNTAHPLTLHHHHQKEREKKKEKRKKKQQRGREKKYCSLFLFFNVAYICETSTSYRVFVVLSLWFGVYHYLPTPSQPLLCPPFSAPLALLYPPCIF